MMPPDHLDERLARSAALIAAGNFAEAKTLLTETVSRFPDAAKAWRELGVAEDKLRNHQQAEQHLRHSLKLDDADGDTLAVLGGLYFYDLDRPDDAMRCFRRGLALDAGDTYALLNYLTVAAVTGRGESALREWGPTLGLSVSRCGAQIDRAANLPWCHYDLGQTLFFQGRYAECRSAVRAALVHSSAWQVASARLAYERLAGVPAFAAAAHAVLEEFPAGRPTGRDA
jgi:tetratricopeptide (TPR) repeat protein